MIGLYIYEYGQTLTLQTILNSPNFVPMNQINEVGWVAHSLGNRSSSREGRVRDNADNLRAQQTRSFQY